MVINKGFRTHQYSSLSLHTASTPLQPSRVKQDSTARYFFLLFFSPVVYAIKWGVIHVVMNLLSLAANLSLDTQDKIKMTTLFCCTSITGKYLCSVHVIKTR